MPVARPEPPETRVIAHVDLDCFYVQVEQRRHPELKGKPTAVVMYNPWKGGGIIAVGYEARHSGVTRNMRGDDAKKVCPDINLIQVPTHFGKADLSIYRDAGSEVVAVFSRGGVCERASIDEVYLDITDTAVALLKERSADVVPDLSGEVLSSHIIGLDQDLNGTIEGKEWLSRSNVYASKSDQLLACGAMIIAELRMAVYAETGFTTSAGIAHNKMLAKLASGMHKPAQQTLIPSSGAPVLLASLPTKKIKGLGGKLGKALESDLGIKTMGDLLSYPESKLQDLYGTNTGTWLWQVARGMSGDEVEGRTLPKSHGCGKTFPGPKSLKTLDSVAHWLSELSGELQERLDLDLHQNNRTAQHLVCHATGHLIGKGSIAMKPFPSKSCAIRYGKEKIASDAFILFKRALSDFCPHTSSLSPVKGEGTGYSWGVTALTISASNILDASGTAPITRYFSSPVTMTASCSTNDPTSVIAASLSVASSPVSSSSNSEVSTLHRRLDMRSNEWKDPKDIKYRVTQSCTTNIECLEDVIMQSFYPSHIHSDLKSSQQTNGTVCHDETSSGGCLQTSSATEMSEETGRIERDRPSPPWGPLSAPVESCSYTARQIGIGDSETELICTPKFGVPGSPLKPLTALEFADGPADEANLVQHEQCRSQNRDCERPEAVTNMEVINCSALEDSISHSETSVGGNSKADRADGERVTSGRQVGESPTRVLTLSLGLDSGSEGSPATGSEKFSNLLTSSPSSTTEMYSPRVTQGRPLSRPFQYKDDNVGSSLSGSQTNRLSKKLVFQRVDELWEKSRPTSQLTPTKKAGSSTARWNYQEHEIDEAVLSELPEDIQHELRSQLGLKKPKKGKMFTINDFFRIGSPGAK